MLSAIPRPRPLPIRLTLLAGAVTALLAAPSASAGPAAKRVVKTAENATLGKTILTSNRGRTLYSLSAETGGRFICVGDCLASWKPLVVPEGVKPKGPVPEPTPPPPYPNPYGY